MGEPRLTVTGGLTAEQVAGVMRLVDAVTEEDGVRPLDEHVLLHLRYGGEPPARNLLLHSGDQLAGYAHLDPTDPVAGPSAELTVAPAHRGRGYGRALTSELLRESPDGRLRLWAHGNHEAAGKLAAGMGFERVRSLWQMRRSLSAPLPAPEFPETVRVRTFVPGQDERAWTSVNARAFAEHPEQGAHTLEDLRLRENEPWFDPAGFFIAESVEREGTILGFHWTKVHGGNEADDHGHEPLGEVYVVGVDPAARGMGLGRALTLLGLRHLRDRGLSQVMLYVEATNESAIRLYQSLGFDHWDTDVMFRSVRPFTETSRGVSVRGP